MHRSKLQLRLDSTVVSSLGDAPPLYNNTVISLIVNSSYIELYMDGTKALDARGMLLYYDIIIAILLSH